MDDYTTKSPKNKCPKYLAVFFIKAAFVLIGERQKPAVMGP